MGLLAASKPCLDPTNPYNQAWQSTEHFHFATQGHHRMVQPHYHVNPSVHQRDPFRFGAPLPPDSNFQQPYYQCEQSCNDVFNWDVNFTGNSSISAHRGASRCNPSNVGGASQQHPDTSTSAQTYVKEGCLFFVRTPPASPPMQSAVSVPTPPITPVSANTSLSSENYSPTDYMGNTPMMSPSEVSKI